MDALSSSILRAMCFADAVGMALSPLEMRRLLGIGSGPGATLERIAAALREDAELASALSSKDGFYALRGSEPLLAARQEALAVAEEKWLVARRAIGRLRRLPWIRLIAVCNTVGMGNPRRGSDVDVFIVVRPGRIWASRLLVHGALAAGALARRGGRVEDKLCLSFFVTDEAVDLSRVMKSPSDPYLAVWLATLVSVLDRGGAYDALLAANGWITEVLPSFAARSPAAARSLPAPRSGRHAALIDAWLGALLDRSARAMQRPRIVTNVRSRLHDGGNDVVVTESMLKFHERDTRDSVREAFLERAARYGV